MLTIMSTPATEDTSRSRSRGRDFVRPTSSHQPPLTSLLQTSSGRGGAGNIRPASHSRDANPSLSGPDDFSPTRGRDIAPPPHLTSPTGIISSGRGGAGNMRSPSRGPAQPIQTPAEHSAIVAAAERDAELPHSSGRGGFGNIVSRSRSRSRGPAEIMQSSGRGGAGNIVGTGGVGAGDKAIWEEAERRAYRQAEGMCV